MCARAQMWMAKLITHEMIAEAAQNGNQEDEPERLSNRYLVQDDQQHGGEDDELRDLGLPVR